MCGNHGEKRGKSAAMSAAEKLLWSAAGRAAVPEEESNMKGCGNGTAKQGEPVCLAIVRVLSEREYTHSAHRANGTECESYIGQSTGYSNGYAGCFYIDGNLKAQKDENRNDDDGTNIYSQQECGPGTQIHGQGACAVYSVVKLVCRGFADALLSVRAAVLCDEINRLLFNLLTGGAQRERGSGAGVVVAFMAIGYH